MLHACHPRTSGEKEKCRRRQGGKSKEPVRAKADSAQRTHTSATGSEGGGQGDSVDVSPRIPEDTVEKFGWSRNGGSRK